MAWDHKGFKIDTLPNGNFVCEFSGGVRIVKGSLSAVKKDIDKRLEQKAKEEVLDFPVLVLRKSSRFSSESKRDVISSVITGVDADTLKVKGIDDQKGNWVNEFILPASKENQKLIDDYVWAEAEFKRLKDLVEARDVDRFGNTFGPNNIGYDEAVKRLKESYKKAQCA